MGGAWVYSSDVVCRSSLFAATSAFCWWVPTRPGGYSEGGVANLIQGDKKKIWWWNTGLHLFRVQSPWNQLILYLPHKRAMEAEVH